MIEVVLSVCPIDILPMDTRRVAIVETLQNVLFGAASSKVQAAKKWYNTFTGCLNRGIEEFIVMVTGTDPLDILHCPQLCEVKNTMIMSNLK